jgi:hypothetical protein
MKASVARAGTLKRRIKATMQKRILRIRDCLSTECSYLSTSNFVSSTSCEFDPTIT